MTIDTGLNTQILEPLFLLIKAKHLLHDRSSSQHTNHQTRPMGKKKQEVWGAHALTLSLEPRMYQLSAIPIESTEGEGAESAS